MARRVAQLAVLLWMLVAVRSSWAAPTEDQHVTAELDKIVSTDIAEANFGAARRRLSGLVDRCRKKANACASKTQVNVHVMLGIVAAQMGQRDQALTSFAVAFEIDPTAQIPAGADVTEATKRLFAEARADYDAKHPRADDPYKVVWKKRDAATLYVDGLAAQKTKDWKVCIDKIRAALDIEESAGARMHLAECLDGAGRLVESAREVSSALERAGRENNQSLVAAAAPMAHSLVKRFGKVKFEIPPGFADLKITFDDRLVPRDRLHAPVVVDPGEHRMRAEGTVAGNIVIDGQTVTVPEGQTITVSVAPKARAVTAGQYECLLNAKSEAELAACFAKSKDTVLIRAGAEISGYVDTQRVNVVTPAIRAGIDGPTRDWSVNASYLVDVVSAASADVVSMASPRFGDVRHAGTVAGNYKLSPVNLSAAGSLSVEHDYVSRGFDGTVGVDLLDKQFTPQVGYGLGYDTIGRAGTPYDVFSNYLTTHTIHGSATIILSPRSLLVVGGSIALERGDQSKPYRYIPMFAPGSSVPNHASADYVNAVRLPERPLEQLPLERDRFAIQARYVHRIRAHATLRLEERLYTDSWGIKASTSEARYLVDVSSRLLVWSALRLHVQSAASFYERAYFAIGDPNGTVQVPIVRTTDRELGSLLAPSPSLGARLSLTSPESKVQMGWTVQGTVMATKYFDSLYTGSRMAIFGTTGFDFELQ
jgi:hypothetical protein